MNISVQRADERGVGDHGWLSSRFSFSFADWYNPARMGFGALRVLNDDTIAPSSGFGMHPHRDMEIITIVTAGEVTHEDSMGNRGVVRAGEVQVMSAGTGVVHSEKNNSTTEPLQLFQLWITPRERGLVPRYAQKVFDKEEALLVSPDGREGSLSIAQDAFISRIKLTPGVDHTYTLNKEGNGVFVFVVSGQIRIGEYVEKDRDALEVRDTHEVLISAEIPSLILCIEVPLN